MREGLIKINNLLLILLLSNLLASCAGPYSPFGALSEWPKDFRTVMELKNEPKRKVIFYPQSQILHRTTDLQILIEDNKLIPENYVLEIYYNGSNITNSFLNKAKIKRYKNQLHIIFENLSLGVKKQHEIYFKYQSHPGSKATIAKFDRPQCNINYIDQRLDTNDLLNKVFRVSSNLGVNPYLIMGLIAQESSFNYKAVSTARALGLTQVTPLAEKHILEKHPNWPSYPGLSDKNYLELKAILAMDEANPGNEWRLDIEKSITGSIEYIRYIQKFWKREKSKDLLGRSTGNPNVSLDIILASYNSGPWRVKRALEKLGSQWIDSNQLGEARKYVRKINSYCIAFQTNLHFEKNFFNRLAKYEMAPENQKKDFYAKGLNNERTPASERFYKQIMILNTNSDKYKKRKIKVFGNLNL